MSAEEWLRHLSAGSVLVPFGISLYRFRAKGYGWLTAYLLVAVLAEAAGTYTYFAGYADNLFVYNLFTIGELTCLGLFLRTLVRTSWMRKGMLGAIVAFDLAAAVRYIRDPYGYDNVTWGLSNALLIVFVLLFFVDLLRRSDEVERLGQYPPFWIASGMLLFFSGTMLTYFFGTYVIQNYRLLGDLWRLGRWLNILFHLLVSIGLLQISPRDTARPVRR